MRIAIAGSSGLIGTALVAHLEADGHQVVRITRSGGGPGHLRWDIDAGTSTLRLEGLDGVVHLAGEGIAEKRWTDEQKPKIVESRATAPPCSPRAGPLDRSRRCWSRGRPSASTATGATRSSPRRGRGDGFLAGARGVGGRPAAAEAAGIRVATCARASSCATEGYSSGSTLDKLGLLASSAPGGSR